MNTLLREQGLRLKRDGYRTPRTEEFRRIPRIERF